MEILDQLRELFLAAAPTVVLVFLFYLFLRWSFFAPIERILAERRKRTEGARQEAEAIRLDAQEKLRAYREELRKIRGEIFVEQEAFRRRILDERQHEVREARLAAQKSLRAAKKSLENDVQAARRQLEQSSNMLAGEIAEAILAGGQPVPISLRREESQ